jgi:hypothetical protein
MSDVKSPLQGKVYGLYPVIIRGEIRPLLGKDTVFYGSLRSGKATPDKKTARTLLQCFLVTSRGRIVAYGQAVKNPRDNHCRQIALQIAFGRAIHALSEHETKESKRFSKPQYAYAARGNALPVQKAVEKRIRQEIERFKQQGQ